MDPKNQQPISPQPPSHMLSYKISAFFMIPVFLLGIVFGIFLPFKNDRVSSFKFFAAPTVTPFPTHAPTPRPTNTPIPSPTPSKVGMLTFPTANATLCVGQNYPISWLVPADTQNVALDINPPSGLPHKITIATNPGTTTNENDIKGSYIWKAGENLDNTWLRSGPGYRLAITVFGSGNAGYQTYGNFFTLTSCP